MRLIIIQDIVQAKDCARILLLFRLYDEINCILRLVFVSLKPSAGYQIDHLIHLFAVKFYRCIKRLEIHEKETTNGP